MFDRNPVSGIEVLKSLPKTRFHKGQMIAVKGEVAFSPRAWELALLFVLVLAAL